MVLAVALAVFDRWEPAGNLSIPWARSICGEDMENGRREGKRDKRDFFACLG